jgi:hypothetical protein
VLVLVDVVGDFVVVTLVTTVPSTAATLFGVSASPFNKLCVNLPVIIS